jgi:hypothetical protein
MHASCWHLHKTYSINLNQQLGVGPLRISGPSFQTCSRDSTFSFTSPLIIQNSIRFERLPSEELRAGIEPRSTADLRARVVTSLSRRIHLAHLG